VYAVVILDTILGVVQARIARQFNWAFLPEFINTMIKYSIYLLFSNAVDHFAKITGIRIEGMGLFAIASVLLLVEGASIIDSIQKLPKKNKTQ
jgi:hypothetical protein